MFVGRDAADDQSQLVDALGVLVSGQNADLTSLGFSNQVSFLDLRRIHEVEQMFREGIEVIIDLRLIRVAMAEIVDGEHAKFFRKRDEISYPGLGVSAAAMQ